MIFRNTQPRHETDKSDPRSNTSIASLSQRKTSATRLSLRLALAALIYSGTTAVSTQARSLNNNEDHAWSHAEKRLSRRGFNNIKIKKITACKNGRLYSMDVKEGRSMFRNKRYIGNCPTMNDRDDYADYRDNNNAGYGNHNSYQNDVTDYSDNDELKALSLKLKRKGYSYINMKPKGRGFAGTACKGRRNYRLETNRGGRVNEGELLGNCPQLLHADLKRLGYNYINIKPTGKGYRGTACKGVKNYKIVLSKWGKVTKRTVAGRCPKLLNNDLSKRGYTYINMKPKGRGLIGTACMGSRNFKLQTNQWGKIIRRVPAGRCPAYY